MFVFVDRRGDREVLSCFPNETVRDLLLRYRIPPTSVIVLQDNIPVPDDHVIDETNSYVAMLIEGYDINYIRESLTKLSHPKDKGGIYLKGRLAFSKSGNLNTEARHFSSDEIVEHVEGVILETCNEFGLIEDNCGVLIGLSGGVDSSSLLIALASIQEFLPSFRLVAVTFEDFDSRSSPTFTHASTLAKRFDVEHYIAPAGLAEEVFHLNRPLRDILPRLMETKSSHQVMYIDHHTTRRVLEVFAAKNGLDRIALGLHTTDLVAGLLNGFLTGYNIADLPHRKLGNTSYIYPLAFIPKRELHLYHHQKTGAFANHSFPNDWEVNPKDRNFYYYMADQLQSEWPGIEVMLFTAHNLKLRRQSALRYESCTNCGASILHQPFTMVNGPECDACIILRQEGYLS